MPLAESSITLVIATVVGAVAAAMAASLPDASAAVTQAASLLDDSRLRLVCVAGSLGGAVLSVMLFTIQTHKELAQKLISSSISGIVFSPVIIRYAHLESSTDLVLAVSAVTALLSWGVLQIAVPFAQSWFRRRYLPDEDSKPTTKL